MAIHLRNSLMLLTSTFVLGAALTGCSKTEVPSKTPEATAAINSTPPKPEMGSFGVDLNSLDRTQTPGDNFFDYVNGNWVKNTEIPADRSRQSSFNILAEVALARTRTIAEEAANNKNAESDNKKIGNFYKAFMDEAGIEAKGIAPIQAELDAIAALKDKTELAHALGQTLRADVDVLNSTDYYTNRLFGLWVSQNLDKPNEYAAYLLQGGLGMPDRDFYLEGGRMVEMRKNYQDHITKVLTLAGINGADAKAKNILALEIAIARSHATQEDSNDVKKGANYWTRADFAAKAPGLNWDAYFEGASLKDQANFIVWQPSAAIGISKLVSSQSIDTWKDYLAFHALDRASSNLPKSFADEYFDFYQAKLNGTPKQQDRWKRGITALNDSLGEAVGKIYVERYFSPETKRRADEMVKNLLAAFGKRIDALEWMAPATKSHAKAKLATLKVGMGYPENWRDYSTLQINANDALGNSERAELFEYQRNIAKLGTPMDRTEWYLLPQTVNALNVPLENRLLFPAAILEAPFFDGAADDAVNYGAIGAVIGHEVTHSFDSSGALFDEQGRMVNWWTPEDLAKFDAAGAALAAQYDAYKPFPDLAVNGKLTLGENIADVAGLATAHDAYVLSQQGKPAVVLEGFSPEQRFFLAWAQAWRTKAREPAARNAVLTDVHAPAQYRAETVRNQDAWYSAFDVKEGQQRYLAPDNRVKVW